MELRFEESLIAHVAGQCEASEAGARNIDYLLQSRILPEISQTLIERLVEGTLEGPVSVGIASDGTTSISAGETKNGDGSGNPAPRKKRRSP